MEKEKLIIVFDATELDNFGLCKFRWHAVHHMNLRPKLVKHYFETGTLLHYYLEEYYKLKKERSVSQDDIEHIVELGRIKSCEFDVSLEELAEFNFQFREYHRYYEDENIIPLHVEEPFTILLYEDEDFVIYISGKPDLVFMYKGSNNIAVMDHKKVSRESAISPMRNQFNLYATAIKTDTVIVNKIGFQKTKKPSERFLRTPFVYNQELLDEWKTEVIFKAKEMVMFEKSGYFPKERTSCEKFDGCFLQRYCCTRPSAREFLIGSEYIIGESWDVGKKLEEEK